MNRFFPIATVALAIAAVSAFVFLGTGLAEAGLWHMADLQQLVTPLLAAPAGAAVLDERSLQAELAELERRALELTNSVTDDLPAERVRAIEIEHGGLCDRIADLRKRILDILSQRSRQNPSFPHVGVYGRDTLDNPEFAGGAVVDALYARMAGKPAEGAAKEFRGRTMIEMGAAILEARGERPLWGDRHALLQQLTQRRGGMHGTSDFPILAGILHQAGQRILLDGYQAAECPLKLLARRRTTTDFRPVTMIKAGEMPRLERVNEHGEIKSVSRGEAKERGSLAAYGSIIAFTEPLLRNDDVEALADQLKAFGSASAETEAAEIISLFDANGGDGATMDDGYPIYATGAHRGNKASAGGGLDITTVSAGRRALREMKGLDGKTPLNVVPKHLVVGPALETAGEQLLATLSAAEVENVNPFGSGRLTLHVEPRFTGNEWRLFADPATLPTLIILALEGEEAPRLEQRAGWETLGIEFRAVLHFGCFIADWRGTYLNPGSGG